MTSAPLFSWLDMLQSDCTHTPGLRLNFIVDQCGSGLQLLPGIVSVFSPEVVHSLFTDLPEAHLIDLAPLLIQVDFNEPLQRQWFAHLLKVINPSVHVLALHSLWPFADLADYLGRCLNASNGGVSHLFRFYDPRLFPLLVGHVLDAAQRQQLLRPVLSWNWLDRDGVSQRLTGHAESPELAQSVSPFELTDAQMETLGCVCDATAAVRNLYAALPAGWGAERRFQECYTAMRKATEAGLLVPDQREQFVFDSLCSVNQP
ncbi:DUF4123 domain-containing protein [Pseudomonas turukhanskensis]|uniref:DUF4123 domain-containing protein n=1 Tax=Pseudomonas turukhanskensis TaxID=1806536 RepID=A0A9W6K4G9_9PSED|nr:DUF4123 domain-containing protein [Pseudomonas turukhanskensis]GLK89281.1 hypothetical protein GCM10017655_23430 [Pseudomonas turukhanskensis]